MERVWPACRERHLSPELVLSFLIQSNGLNLKPPSGPTFPTTLIILKSGAYEFFFSPSTEDRMCRDTPESRSIPRRPESYIVFSSVWISNIPLQQSR